MAKERPQLVVRLAELTEPQRCIVLALIDARRQEQFDSRPDARPIAGPQERRRRPRRGSESTTTSASFPSSTGSNSR